MSDRLIWLPGGQETAPWTKRANEIRAARPQITDIVWPSDFRSDTLRVYWPAGKPDWVCAFWTYSHALPEEYWVWLDSLPVGATCDDGLGIAAGHGG